MRRSRLRNDVMTTHLQGLDPPVQAHYARAAAALASGKPCCTDKLPGNWVYLGAIRATRPALGFVDIMSTR